jgi:hypothetical protein
MASAARLNLLCVALVERCSREKIWWRDAHGEKIR